MDGEQLKVVRKVLGGGELELALEEGGGACHVGSRGRILQEVGRANAKAQCSWSRVSDGEKDPEESE